MRYQFCLLLTILVSALFTYKINAGNDNAPKHYKILDELLIEAGCKEMKYDYIDQKNKLKGVGILLSRGACIPKTYQKDLVPEKGVTKVYTTIEKQKVRQIHDNENMLSLDLTLTMRWMDPLIKTNFTEEEKQNGGIVLRSTNWRKLWTPHQIYVYDNNIPKYAYLIKSVTLLGDKEANQHYISIKHEKQRKTIVELIMDTTTTFYCNYDFSSFPMDTHACEFRFGSRGVSGAPFVLYDPEKIYHNKTNYNAANFDMSVKFYDEKRNTGLNKVGLNIMMVRVLKPFVMKYYLPCVAIVFVSQLSFIIPLSAIPGRIALLVTLFLALTNIFMHQMVSIKLPYKNFIINQFEFKN